MIGGNSTGNSLNKAKDTVTSNVKDKTSGLKDQTQEKVESGSGISDKMTSAKGEVEGKTKSATNTVKEKMGSAKENVKDMVGGKREE